MTRLAPDTKANLTLGVLATILGCTVTATVFVWDMKRDLKQALETQAVHTEQLEDHHDMVTILWHAAGFGPLSQRKGTNAANP